MAKETPLPSNSTEPTAFDVLLRELREECAAAEAVRTHVLVRRRKGRVGLLIAVALGAAAGGIALAFQPPEAAMFIGLGTFALAAATVGIAFFAGGGRTYADAFKQNVGTRLASLLAPEVNYRPAAGLTKEVYHQAGLHRRADRYRSHDLFAGRIGDTEIAFSEVHAEDRQTTTDSKGRTRTKYVTIFRGLLFVADFHKHFADDVTVKADFAERNFGWLGRKLQRIGGNVQSLENPIFEEMFVVRADDPIETRYILTPDMQERLVALKRRWNTDVRFAFRDSRVFVAIDTALDFFEPSLSLPAASPEQIRSLADQMLAVFGLVEALDLNTRIWTKE